jgi:hypothetical protein
MRAVDCPCGEYVEASTDQALFDDMRRHADEDHPDQYSDAALKTLIASSAYDVREEA